MLELIQGDGVVTWHFTHYMSHLSIDCLEREMMEGHCRSSVTISSLSLLLCKPSLAASHLCEVDRVTYTLTFGGIRFVETRHG